MADWKIFCDLYTANFGRLTESDGLKEWAKFVEQEVRDVELLRAALQPYIDRYAAALDNMEPVPKRPTLGQVKRAFFAQCDRLRQERAGSEPVRCAAFAAGIDCCSFWRRWMTTATAAAGRRISGTSDGTVFAAWNWRNVRVARRGTSRNCVIGSR